MIQRKPDKANSQNISQKATSFRKKTTGIKNTTINKTEKLVLKINTLGIQENLCYSQWDLKIRAVCTKTKINIQKSTAYPLTSNNEKLKFFKKLHHPRNIKYKDKPKKRCASLYI